MRSQEREAPPPSARNRPQRLLAPPLNKATRLQRLSIHHSHEQQEAPPLSDVTANVNTHAISAVRGGVAASAPAHVAR